MENISTKKKMPQVLSSTKLYLLVVLLPQLIYLFTKTQYCGLAAVCESCAPSTYIDLYLALLRDPSSLSQCEASCETCRTSAEEDVSRTVNSNETSAVEYPKESASVKAGYVEGYQDRVAVVMCSCSSNLSTEEAALIQSPDHDTLGGWHIPHALPDLAGRCNIKRRNISLTRLQFLEEFAFTEPVVLTGVSDQSIFKAHSTKRRLLEEYGAELITVATANTHSYRKVKMTLCEYIERYMKPQTLNSFGNETFYHFGDNDRDSWDSLFSLYQLPPYQLPDMEPVLSFGLAGPGTGVPFHIHGPTFAETVYGRKRWFLYPPDSQPPFHPDVTTLHWLIHTYPTLSQEDKPMECTLNPGEVIYFPDRWWHATLNLDSALFMSTFYS